MASIHKKDIVAHIKETTGCTGAAAEAAFNAFVGRATAALAAGDTVYLDKFGTLKPVHRAARKGFNPQTQEPINIAAKRAVKFEMAPALTGLLNK